jgi:hypothetical protein
MMYKFDADEIPLVVKVANTDTEYLRTMRDAINRELQNRAQDAGRAREQVYA